MGTGHAQRIQQKGENMIVILTEEASMQACLEIVIPQLWPDSVLGVDWIVLSFHGKSDLKKSIPKKMRRWNYRNPHFVILGDNDGRDCRALKQELCDIANKGRKPFHVRIVCQELESWLLGDLAAIKQAYSKAAIPKNKAKFRKPDKLGNASQELDRLIQAHAKTGRARKIAKHLDFGGNGSGSFQLFVQTMQRLIKERRMPA